MVPKESQDPSPPPVGHSISDAKCVPHPGEGVVARFGEVFLAVAGGAEPGVRMLIEHCLAVAEVSGDGRMLSRRLAGFLTTYDQELPAFAAAAPVETGIAVFLQGDAHVSVGSEFTLSGASSLAWVDRLIPWPVPALIISAGHSTEPACGLFNLQRGVVPGAGMTLLVGQSTEESSADATPESTTGEAAGMSDVATPDAPSPSVSNFAVTPRSERWPGQAVESAPFESVVISSATSEVDEDDRREPLPVVSKGAIDRPQLQGPMVRGVYCKNNHFNDPQVLFCAVCGINMVQQTPDLTEGPRPPLGVLLLDDGSAFQLDADYVLGREPAHDPEVRAGQLRGITLNDANKSVSRAHARIELRQWEVTLIDNNSANGTYVAADNQGHWTPLVPGTPHTLSSGSSIRLGGRTLVFNSYRGK